MTSNLKRPITANLLVLWAPPGARGWVLGQVWWGLLRLNWQIWLIPQTAA
jgi:hypothetical protein